MGPGWQPKTTTKAESDMTRRNRKMLKLALVAGVAVLVGAAIAGPKDAGAAITDPVNYEVGGLRVFSTPSRNPSCSLTRVLRNDSEVPLFVIGTALWDEQLVDADPGNNGGVFPTVGDSQYTGPQWVQPGEQVTAVWNGVDRDPPTLSAGPVQLSWSVILQPGVDVGFGHVEFVEACDRAPGVPSDTTPTVSVDTTLPVVPPSTVVQAPGPDPTPPPLVGSDPEPPTTVTSASDTGVLTSSVGPLEELPNTGPGDVVAVSGLIGALCLIVGSTLRALGWKVGRR